MKLRKIVAVMAAMLVLLCVAPFSALAAEESINITANTGVLAGDSLSISWESANYTFVCEKDGSSTPIRTSDSDHFRCYQGTTTTIAGKNGETMTQVVITCTAADYANKLAACTLNDGWTAAANGSVVTFTSAGSTSLVIGATKQWRLNNVKIGGQSGTPSTPPVTPDEPTGDTLTIPQANELGLSHEPNTYTEAKYYVTGKIDEIANATWGNLYIADEEGNRFYVYGTYNADGSARYDAMDPQPQIGDTITVYGIIGTYKGTEAQMKNGWVTEYIAGGETPDEPDQPDEPAGGEYEVDDAPVAGTAYKFGMIQGNVSATEVYYLKGGMDGYYMATSNDVAEAIDVYLEETTGGYYLYAMVNGSKQYINMVVSGTHVNGAYENAASTVYTYDTEAYTVIADVEGAPYWFGTRNDKTYTTVGPCKTEYAGFYCQFYAPVGGDTPIVPPVTPDEPIVPDEPELPEGDTLTIVEANELGLSHEPNTYTEAKYYVTGKVVGINNTTYGNMYLADEDGNQLYVYGAYSADGEIRFDELEKQPKVGDTVTVYGIVGTYNGTEAQMKNVWITDIIEGEPEEGDDLPPADSYLTIEEAIALGSAQLHNIYTENKYYVIGQITEVYNDVYGNMYVTDEAGNVLTVYGTYGADGELRYDALESAPVAGDYVKLYGIIGQYNGTPQMKNGWIIEVSSEPIEAPEAPVDPENPVDPEDPENPEDPADPEGDDNANDTDPMGENVTGIVLAAILLALAIAGVVVFSKKRA